ncbi:hypothetical protein NLJ89_g1704 [Agrocybe chaxingu]|uniref:non-specific serine/threonine protein kinase n=1 Tax=Agrocybe chaxingu TaxID=84603 RepID=A0A9W8MZJ3_9AGAR|nr:hypothetical protein NLJ89_g1704 [Agrocybe chaxingu]
MQPPKQSHDPKMIGLWKVGRTLGKGFSGHVRIARHSKTGKYAAIKIISKSSLGSRVSLNRLPDEVEHNLLAVEREIVVMKLIDHPNIMKLYDVWETSSSLYLILEYVQGGELFEYLCSKGRRPTSEALGYFQQIICAVDYCHRFNIAHRDLKLENVLIDQDSNIKVADFGMAAWQDSARGNLLRTSCGSPHYAAPEVISGKPYNGATADIWSCGIILYALLAAKLPFDDDDCPALLQKISVGRFDMPTDIEPRAQDLILRMLTTDVKKRITMPEIMRHPFFLSQPLKNPKSMSSGLKIDSIAHPIRSRSAIDPDIFANLRTLWHGTQDEELMDALVSPERNWQKGIYHLLLNYRKKHAEVRQESEELQAKMERRKSKRAEKVAKAIEQSLPPRDGPPTPRRARDRGMKGSTSDTSSTRNETVPIAPLISLSVPSPERPTRANSPAAIAVGMELPAITAPELEDEKIQVFFQQIANHLNVLRAKTNSMDANSRSSSPAPASELGVFPPVLKLPEMPTTPTSSPRRDVEVAKTSTPLRKTPNGTRPLSVQKSRLPRPIITTFDAADKENITRITEADLIHRRSPLTPHSMTMGDNKRLQVFDSTPAPASRKPSKLKKKRYSTSPVSPMFSDAGSSFTGSPTGSCGPPKRSWLDNVFKFKPATYNLLSRYDVHTTRSECRRLLVEMDMLVSLEDSEKLGVLKCRSHDVKDPNNAYGQAAKSVKFRVEMQWPTPQLCHDGFLVSLLLVQEKGSLDTFKGVYDQLVRKWTLGDQTTSSGMISGTPSSTNAVGG